MRWFRFYDEVLDDPKVQRLPPHLFKAWINLLCLASKRSGKFPSDDDVAFQLRISVQDAAQQMDELILAGLVDIDPSGARIPHNWGERQYISDSSAERTRKYREKRTKKACDVTSDDEVTVQNQNQIQKQNNNSVLPSSRAKGEEQGVDFGLRGWGKAKGKGGGLETVRARAEGFGLQVDEILEAATTKDVRNPSAYFTSLAVKRLQERMPAASEAILRDALWGKEYAVKLVFAALTGPESVA